MAKSSKVVIDSQTIRVDVINMESDLPVWIVWIRVSSCEAAHRTGYPVSLKYSCPLGLVNLVRQAGKSIKTGKYVFIRLEIVSITVREDLHTLVFAELPNASLVIPDFGDTGKLLSGNLFAYTLFKKLPDSVSCAQVR
jgi:hypothetical protein